MWPIRHSRNKFGAVAVHDMQTGESFASKGEMADWRRLQLLERAGQIANLQRQSKVVLIPARGRAPQIAWHVDASYTERGRTVWVDFKPRPMTPRETLLLKLWRHFGPGVLLITGKGGKTLKEVMPCNS